VSLRAIVPGPLATIQDGGRLGFRAFGVPVSGPFDRISAAIANALVGNAAGAAVLELAGFGGIYEAESEMAIGLAGALMPARVECRHEAGRTLSIPCATTLKVGERLILGATAVGFRLYVGTNGGWRTSKVLGSRSSEQPILAGDLLPAGLSRTAERRTEPRPIAGPDRAIRYVDGPNARLIEASILERSEYRLGRESNRMGLRLEGHRIAIEDQPNSLSMPVGPGAIQIAGGLPIVLGPACGTMGGYPQVGHVLSVDLNRLAQARPGDVVRFRRVEIAEAHAIDRVYRADLRSLTLRLATAASELLPARSDLGAS
jgi:5-oxoprolinase (ATP-hydrolysing) subunit C